MDKFSFVYHTLRVDFEILADGVQVEVPALKVKHKITGLDFDPKEEFEGCDVQWCQWAFEALEEAELIVFCEYENNYVNTDWVDEMRQESKWEADHIRQESRSDIFL